MPQLLDAPHTTADEPGRLYRLIADTIPHMVWTARADGGLDYFNQRCYEYTGLGDPQLAGWEWKAVIHPEDWDRCLATWTRSLQSGERYEIEYRLRRRDGVYRWHHGTAVPLRDAAGCLVRWFGTCTDIEDQIRSAQLLEQLVRERTTAMRDAERRLQDIIENEPECVKLLDGEGRLLEMNAAGLRMVEADDARALIGQCVYPLVAPEHRAEFRSLTERVCRGERGRLVFEIVGMKGTRRWLETHAAPFRDSATGVTRLLGVTRDITDARRVEQALRESERRFQLFMDLVPAQAWIRDADGRYVYVNRQYARSNGREPADMVGRSLEEFFADDASAAFRERDAQVLSSGAPTQYTDHLPAGNWLKVKFAIPLADGRTGIAGISLDISERVRAEERAARYAMRNREMVGRLIHAQELERRRLSEDLHDLVGQNLSALGIQVAALRSVLGADPGAAPHLDAIAGLVNDTVELVRGVMTELRPPALEEYGLLPALRWYAERFRERTGMKVSTSALAAGARLPRDSELALFRIVQEALSNAAKHSGGTSVDVAVMEQDGLVRITVEDDGRGFADPVGARGAARGGWGLRTMRERAEAHGGRLRIEFPGRGTRVIVEVPRHAD